MCVEKSDRESYHLEMYVNLFANFVGRTDCRFFLYVILEKFRICVEIVENFW